MSVRLMAAALLAAVLVLPAGAARADYYLCGDIAYAKRPGECPGGGIPRYRPGTLPELEAQKPAATREQISTLLGKWKTKIPGAAWTTPSSRPGYDVLHAGPGATGGYLMLSGDGRYAWGAEGGKEGRWRPGKADCPIELMDGPDRIWKVCSEDGREVAVGDGRYTYYGTR